jgi:hypothetical protein
MFDSMLRISDKNSKFIARWIVPPFSRNITEGQFQTPAYRFASFSIAMRMLNHQQKRQRFSRIVNDDAA